MVPGRGGNDAWMDWARSCRGIASEKFGYQGWREVYLFVERQMLALAVRGRLPGTIEMAAFRRESKVFVKHAMAKMKAEQVATKSFEDDMEWLYQNWDLATIERPDRPDEVVPNPHGLALANSQSIFTLADWACRNRDEFLEKCFKHLLGRAKRKEVDPGLEAKVIDEGLAELDEYIRKFGK